MRIGENVRPVDIFLDKMPNLMSHKVVSSIKNMLDRYPELRDREFPK